MLEHFQPITPDHDDDNHAWMLVTDVGTVIHTRAGQQYYAAPSDAPLTAHPADEATATVGPTRTGPHRPAYRRTSRPPARKRPAA